MKITAKEQAILKTIKENNLDVKTITDFIRFIISKRKPNGNQNKT